jgi:uncharacterized protein
VTARDEALVYTSAPLQAPVTVCGRPNVTLFVRAAEPDADVFVLLSDSFPLGSRDLHLGHAALRLSTWHAFKPGELTKVDLELDALAHDFLPGHQIRLTIVPSLFPLYARNLHGQRYTTAQEIVVADIELHHGPDTPGVLTLPVATLS